MAYWDTSCLLKLYAAEADSADLRAHAVLCDVIATSWVTRLELYAASCRKEAAGNLIAGGAEVALAAYDAEVVAGLVVVRPFDVAVERAYEATVGQCYRRVPPLPVRTLDAIHLATAVVLGEPEMVATDKRLREAAIGCGLRVYPRRGVDTS